MINLHSQWVIILNLHFLLGTDDLQDLLNKVYFGDIADLGAAILMSLGRTKMCVSVALASVHVKSIVIIEINHITHVKYLGRLSETNFDKNLHSGRLTFGRKYK